MSTLVVYYLYTVLNSKLNHPNTYYSIKVAIQHQPCEMIHTKGEGRSRGGREGERERGREGVEGGRKWGEGGWEGERSVCEYMYMYARIMPQWYEALNVESGAHDTCMYMYFVV